ncbi:MAG: BspA family leucine-rich repeat surface protein [Bacteroidota bacterium]
MKLKKLIFLGLIAGFILSCGSDDASVPLTDTPAENNLPEVDLQTLSMAANADVSDTEVIGTLKATDPDGDDLTFSMITNSEELFEVQTTAEGGEVSLAEGKSFDFEGDAKTYEITIGVDDNVGVVVSAKVTIAVSKTNTPPEIAEQTLEVSELLGDTESLEIAFSDADGDTLEFSISDDEDDLFEISATGELSLQAEKSLDFETKTEHVITVTVDDGTATASAAITLVVKNENDEAPEIAADQVFSPAEDLPAGEVFGTVQASDADGETTYTFSIEDENNELFVINSETGVLQLAEGQSLDFEGEENSYVLTIKVSDQVNETTAQITIAVTNVIESLFEDPEAFITTWEIPADNFELNLPIPSFLPLEGYNFEIDWGDESPVETISNLQGIDDIPSHVYEQGTFSIAIKGDFPYFRTDDNNVMTQTMRDALVDVTQWGAIRWQGMNSTFESCSNLEGFSATDVPDLSEVTSMNQMFRNATSFNDGFTDWDFSTITSMNAMFNSATSFNQNISSWDVGHVTVFSNMFYSATDFDQDLGDWNISSVAGQAMIDVFRDSGMSPENYSGTLIGWSAFEDTPEDVVLTGNVTYLCSAQEARDDLINNKGWIIDDAGLAPGEVCP